MPVDARFYIHEAAKNYNLGDLKRLLAAGTDPGTQSTLLLSAANELPRLRMRSA